MFPSHFSGTKHPFQERRQVVHKILKVNAFLEKNMVKISRTYCMEDELNQNVKSVDRALQSW